MNPLTNRDITGRFEVRLSECTGRRYWWGWESGWKDATEIGENGVLTLDADASKSLCFLATSSTLNHIVLSEYITNLA